VEITLSHLLEFLGISSHLSGKLAIIFLNDAAGGVVKDEPR